MKKIYVILSATPTAMGRIIRWFTKSSFNHSSISLTKNWTEMYSFARYKACNPFVGGFVKEFPQRLTLGKDKDVYIKVYEIAVNEDQYDKVSYFISSIKENQEENKYNFKAVLGIFLKRNYSFYNTFTCSDFVAESLVVGDIININFERNIVPDEFQILLREYNIFSGSLKDYNPIKGIMFSTDTFFEKSNIIKEFRITCSFFYNLIKNNSSIHVENVSKITKSN